MTEKIGSVKNPLTIIAIFAGIAEVSGTTILPFMNPENQGVFIYFLMIFPGVLITAFFVTLNFNNKALYAPSDFSDEENYIKIFKYDISKQQDIEISVTQDNLLKEINQDNIELKKTLNDKILFLENQLSSIKNNETKYVDYEEFEDLEQTKLVYVSNFPNAQKFVNTVIKLGYDAEVYHDPTEHLRPKISNSDEHQAIWLGPNIPLSAAKKVIQVAYKMYPFLKYIKVGEYAEPDNDYIYIWGCYINCNKSLQT